MKTSWKATMIACFTGSACMAIINNFAPLLFLTFQQDYHLSFSQLSVLIVANFITQMIVDLLGAKYADRIGYRPCLVFGHCCSAFGTAGLVFLPKILPPFWGLILAMMISAIGGGISEVLVSPVMEGCPTENKSAIMNLTHSFFCWGLMVVVLISALYFALFGIENWEILAMIWALIPLINAFLFSQVPIQPPVAAEKSSGIKSLLNQPIFWVFALIMFSSGAGELAMSQWVSAFAEQALGISKTVGDLLGPCLFAGCMGLTRVFFSKLQEHQLRKWLIISAALCCGTYLTAALFPAPIISLAACAATGFGIGGMWPSALSLASKRLPTGGTALFALMAVAGDLGCSGGPSLIGTATDLFGGNMRVGLGLATIFPALILVSVLFLKKEK